MGNRLVRWLLALFNRWVSSDVKDLSGIAASSSSKI